MRNEGLKVGRAGETAACEYLVEAGHSILDRNWRHGHLEIDIISLASDGIHFVEVKSRTAPVQAEPYENAGPAKMHRIANAAKCYLSEKKGLELGQMEIHIDIVSVVFFGDRTNIEYFPNAYIPIFFGK